MQKRRIIQNRPSTAKSRPRALAGFPALGIAVLVTAAGLLAAPPALAAPRALAVPARPAGGMLGVRPRHSAGQVITVSAATHATTYATLRAYQVTGGKRILVFGPWTARVGYKGIARPGKKREGDGKTPSGSYGFSFYFGVLADDGFAFRFRHAYSYDVWDDDPSSPRYNEWVNERKHSPGADPEPMHQVPAYDYAAVIGYNTARVPGRGSAIFLHVGTDSATAGCVSLPKAELLKVLRWMRPRDYPEIIISAR